MGMFNEGDIIRRTNNYWGQVPVGTICKVTSVVYEDSIQHIYTDVHPYSLNPDNFELVFPKKWCIRGSEELRHWQKYDMNDQCNSSFYQNDFFYYLIDDELIDEWDYIERPPDGYTEITFQQFQIYILKKNIRKPFKLNRK